MNKYEQLYRQLIFYRQNINVLTHQVDTELHHIKPKSIWPELKDDPSNQVFLTIYEHLLAHKFLALWYRDLYGEDSLNFSKMSTALDTMLTTRTGVKLTLDEATEAKLQFSKCRGQLISRALRTPESKAKLSKANKGKKMSPSHKANHDKAMKDPSFGDKISKALTGKKKTPFSKDHRKHLSEAKIGNTNAKGKRSEETCKRIGLSKKGKRIKQPPLKDDQKKLLSNMYTGKIIVNNGVKSIWADPDNIPEGFVRGRHQTRK